MEGTLSNNDADGKTPPTFSPYDELMWRALASTLRNAPRTYTFAGWYRLDSDGRQWLEDNGLDKDDLRAAINYGVAEGLLIRSVLDGIPRIALIERGQGNERVKH